MTSSDRNSAADQLQITVTNVIVSVSTAINLFGFLIIKKSRTNASTKYMQLSIHVSLYLLMTYFGTILNVVVLFPFPGVYCIGWLRDLSGEWALGALVVFYLLFLATGESMVFIFILKLATVARPDSMFRLSPFMNSLIVLFIFSCSILPQLFFVISGFSDTSTISQFVSTSYPSMSFILRYPCLWVLTSSIHWFFFALIFAMTLILICVSFITFSVLVLYELERQTTRISVKKRRIHRQIVSDVVVHAKIMIPFLLSIPISVYLQFFVEEGDDVSVPVAISLCIFIFTPIPTMLMFLFSNPDSRGAIRLIFRLKPAPTHRVKISNISSL